MTRLELDEYEILRVSGLPRIPEESKGDDGKVWTIAIAKVLTRTAEESYAIVKNEIGSGPSVVHVLNEKGIGKILSIHPYRFVDCSLPADVKTLRDLKTLVAGLYRVDMDKVAKLDKEKLTALYQNYRIREHEEKVRAERKHQDMIDEYNRKRKERYGKGNSEQDA